MDSVLVAIVMLSNKIVLLFFKSLSFYHKVGKNEREVNTSSSIFISFSFKILFKESPAPQLSKYSEIGAFSIPFKIKPNCDFNN